MGGSSRLFLIRHNSGVAGFAGLDAFIRIVLYLLARLYLLAGLHLLARLLGLPFVIVRGGNAPIDGLRGA